MKGRINTIWRIIKGTFNKFLEDDPLTYSAAIAFYALFSMPAVLLIIVVVAGQVYGEQAIRGELSYQIEHVVGKASATQIQKIIESVNQTNVASITAFIGIITLLFSATTVFISIQSSLNAIWAVRSKPKSGVLKYVFDRLRSFGMVIFLGFIMLITIISEAVLSIFGGYVHELVSGYSVYLMRLAHYMLSLGLITIIFAIIFKFLPDAKIMWRDVWIGAFVTAVLFVIGRFGISLYLSFSNFSTTYGAAGSLVLILAWVYYSSAILLLGAEFTFIYSRELGEHIFPSENAVKIVYQEVGHEEL